MPFSEKFQPKVKQFGTFRQSCNGFRLLSKLGIVLLIEVIAFLFKCKRKAGVVLFNCFFRPLKSGFAVAVLLFIFLRSYLQTADCK
jgi:hypothetical protein